MATRRGRGRARISGYAKPRFEAVREAFVDNFARGEELGAACCVYHRGEKVVDLWGGVRNERSGAPWEEDTMVIVYSSTKGMSGLAMALAHARGLYDYDERVSTYWPEFAQAGKERVTVRQLLSHQAALFALDAPLTVENVSDPDKLAPLLARQKPAWEPGTRQAYHGVTLGFYESELLRRVDPKHRTLGQYFQDELATPLGLEFYIRLPDSIPDSRLGTMKRFSMLSALWQLPPRTMLAAMNPRSKFRRCLVGSELPETPDHVYRRNFEVPAGGGVGTARAMAHAYGVFATGGKELGLGDGALREVMARPVPPARGFRDACLMQEVAFWLGFMKPTANNRFAHPGGFGAPGTGGSFAFADPEMQLGYAYTPNHMGAHLADPRERRLRFATYRSLGETDPAFVGKRVGRRRQPRGPAPQPARAM